ncbi:hypothetical protein [Streptomyces sp. NPDC046821]|uniref:hypothetical protein n=1 Tax=Streptomyces sp. NPDC046821 TaxID=3154702 RepID=UPI0033D70D83
MTHWSSRPRNGLRSWYETGEDGRVLREAVFDRALEVPRPDLRHASDDGTAGGATVAASHAELTSVRDRFGPLGVQLYEAVYGVMTDGPHDMSHEPVTAERFEQAWRTARSHRHFTRYDSGPLPEGARVTGTVSALPWGPGRTGLFVDMDLLAVPAPVDTDLRPLPASADTDLCPVPAFVDLAWLPRDPDAWPAVGDTGAFEVTTIRFTLRPDYTGLQVRLRPEGARPLGGPSPRPGRP